MSILLKFMQILLFTGKYMCYVIIAAVFCLVYVLIICRNVLLLTFYNEYVQEQSRTY
jgi:hypothetical protein